MRKHTTCGPPTVPFPPLDLTDRKRPGQQLLLGLDGSRSLEERRKAFLRRAVSPKGSGTLLPGWACGTDVGGKAQATQCELLLPEMESTLLAVGIDRGGPESHSCSPPAPVPRLHMVP